MASPPPAAVDAADSGVEDLDAKHGFSRPEMYKGDLAGTVQLYEKHVFICYKEPQSWPSHLETSEQDPLPRMLAASIKAKKGDMPKKTRLTICGGSGEGDILIFPNMIRYKELSSTDVESFVDEVLIHEQEWSMKKAEELDGSFVFVCAHGSRDMRCGVCGPALMQKFEDEISQREMGNQVYVRPCSHIGGHKYAGNVIIYSPNTSGKIEGHWYGYVTPDDVGVLLDEHIGRGKIIHRLWRGQMGLDEEHQKSALEAVKHRDELVKEGGGGCFCTQSNAQSNDNVGKVALTTCCQEKKLKLDDKTSRCGSMCGAWNRVSSCFDAWERGDTLAALAVVGAVAAVAVAFSVFKKSS